MDKQELKKIIKPLIKECIREVLLEEGLKTLTDSQELVKEEKIVQKRQESEQKPKLKQKVDYNKVFKKEVVEKNKKLGFDMGGTGFNPFDGTTPINEVKVPETQREVKVKDMISESAGQWNKILNAMNGRK
jgi:hypothetical protein